MVHCASHVIVKVIGPQQLQHSIHLNEGRKEGRKGREGKGTEGKGREGKGRGWSCNGWKRIVMAAFLLPLYLNVYVIHEQQQRPLPRCVNPMPQWRNGAVSHRCQHRNAHIRVAVPQFRRVWVFLAGRRARAQGFEAQIPPMRRISDNGPPNAKALQVIAEVLQQLRRVVGASCNKQRAAMGGEEGSQGAAQQQQQRFTVFINGNKYFGMANGCCNFQQLLLQPRPNAFRIE